MSIAPPVSIVKTAHKVTNKYLVLLLQSRVEECSDVLRSGYVRTFLKKLGCILELILSDPEIVTFLRN